MGKSMSIFTDFDDFCGCDAKEDEILNYIFNDIVKKYDIDTIIFHKDPYNEFILAKNDFYHFIPEDMKIYFYSNGDYRLEEFSCYKYDAVYMIDTLKQNYYHGVVDKSDICLFYAHEENLIQITYYEMEYVFRYVKQINKPKIEIYKVKHG